MVGIAEDTPRQPTPPLALLWVGNGLGAPVAKTPSAGPKTTLGRPTTMKKVAGTPPKLFGGGGVFGG